MENEKKLENNRFDAYRKELYDISMDENRDVGEAAEVLIARHGWDYDEAEAEKQEFLEYVRMLQNGTTEQNNLVKAYFLG